MYTFTDAITMCVAKLIQYRKGNVSGSSNEVRVKKYKKYTHEMT